MKRTIVFVQVFFGMLLLFWGLDGVFQWLGNSNYGFADVLTGDPEGVFWFMKGALPLFFGILLIWSGLLRRINGG